MLCLFSPDNQGRYCQSLERCFIGKAPSIARVSRTFGSHIAESWLEIQLLDLAEFSGVRKDGMTEKESEINELCKTGEIDKHKTLNGGAFTINIENK